MTERLRTAVVPGLLATLVVALIFALLWSFLVAKPSDIPWSELVPAVIGGAIGALAGGIPSYFIARLGSREVLARDEAARLQQERAAAFRAHVRLAELANGILSLHRQLEVMIAEGSNDPKGSEHLWLAVRPFAGLSDERAITVDATEAAVFVAAGAADYVNDLLLLPKRHCSNIAALKEYARRREILTEQMIPTKFEGDIGSSYLTEEEVKKLMPRMKELNSIIMQVRTSLAEDREIALRLSQQFGPILRKYFDDPKFPGFNLDRVDPPLFSQYSNTC